MTQYLVRYSNNSDGFRHTITCNNINELLIFVLKLALDEKQEKESIVIDTKRAYELLP